MRSTNNFYTGDEYQFRLGVFMTNARFVSQANANKANLYRVGLNHLAALTAAEYKSMLGYRPIDRTVTKGRTAPKGRKADPPDTWDWRTKGAVNAIKDQGQCGSCWAFSTIQASESTYFLYSTTLLSLSESNLVDCDWFSNGCDGGNMITAYEWVILFQGGKFNLESDYPYTPVTGTCKWDSSKGVGLIVDFVMNTPFDEVGLVDLIYTYGPAAIAIDASQTSFQLYTGGIYNDPQCSSFLLDHGVGAIGWGTDGGTAYWLVRNSWGVSWGDQGYIKIIRNRSNACGVATEASIPVQTE
jgi:cathepsin L